MNGLALWLNGIALGLFIAAPLAVDQIMTAGFVCLFLGLGATAVVMWRGP